MPAIGCGTLNSYYRPALSSAEELELMRRIDELHLNHPSAGARMLKREGSSSRSASLSTLDVGVVDVPNHFKLDFFAIFKRAGTILLSMPCSQVLLDL